MIDCYDSHDWPSSPNQPPAGIPATGTVETLTGGEVLAAVGKSGAVDDEGLVARGSLLLDGQQRRLIAAFLGANSSYPRLPQGNHLATSRGPMVFQNRGINIPIVTIDALPGLILKLEPSVEAACRRVDATMAAAQVVRDRGLHHLVVPSTALISFSSAEASERFVIVEEYMHFDAGLPAQRLHYQNYEMEVGEIVEQLTIMACHTTFRDVRWDNIPLVLNDTGLQAVLVDLEPTEGRTLSDAFVDWGSEGYCLRTPGLLGCFPAHAQRILDTAQQELAPGEFAKVDTALQGAAAKAASIGRRNAAIESYHESRGISAATPALDVCAVQEILSRKNEKASERLKAALEDINAVIADQKRRHRGLRYAREWRLTRDGETADSNWEENIYHEFRTLRALLPRLVEAGVVHSVLSYDEARDLDVDIRRHLTSSDLVVQF